MKDWCLLIMVLWGLLVAPLHAQNVQIPQVRIVAQGLPAAVSSVVQTSVETITVQMNDQDGGELQRLRRQAHAAAVQALATEGYFTPTVHIDITEGTSTQSAIWRVEIDAGQRTQITSVQIEFHGGILQDDFLVRRERLVQDWVLPKGRTFRNADWERAKSLVLTDLLNNDFPTARVIRSEAVIHAEDQEAQLVYIIDSGPQIRLIEKKLLGFERVTTEIVERYIRYDIASGFPYRRAALQEWQDQLQASAFFRSVRIYPDLSTYEALQSQFQDDSGVEIPLVMDVPLVVQVNEARPRRANVILGLDSDVGLRAEVVYRQNVVWGIPLELETGFHVDKDRRLGFLDFHFPPTHDGYRYSTGVLVQNTNLFGLHTRQVALGAVQAKISKDPTESSRVEYERRLGARLAYENTDIDGAPSFTTQTATTNWEWIRRDVDTPQDPRTGNLLAVGLGGGTEINGNNLFTRAQLRSQFWYPFNPQHVLVARAEAGQVWAREGYRVPTDFLFRTGGARTVRGFRFLSIGRSFGDAIIGDRSMAVGSVEYNYFLNETVGLAAFVDSGSVAYRFSDMEWYTGVGTGVRVRSPAGPIQVDLAYGNNDRRLRLHFSLGLAL